MRLKNKHILIVGASSGIGRSMIDLFVKEGAKLTLTTTNLEKVYGGGNWNELDVTDEKAVIQFAGELENLDGVVYLPGIVKLFPVSFLNSKELNKVREVVFDGAVYTMNAVLRGKKLNKGASLVFISSISSSFPYKGGAAYTSSKAALETYSKTIALELSDKKVRSNSIKAGLVQTAILEQTKNDMPEDLYNDHKSSYPLGFGEPKDIANAALFLLSDESKWITGTEIIVDGGLTTGA